MTSTAVTFTVRRQGRRIGVVTYTASTGWTVDGLGAFLTRSEALGAIRSNAGVSTHDLLTYHRD